jgi:hypothetical protein
MLRGMVPRLSSLCAWMIALLIQVTSAYAANAIQAGVATLDPPTLCCIGVVVPLTGDDNYNAQATLEYRTQGGGAWSQALPLLRVRPDTLGPESPPGDYGLPVPTPMFAGSIFGLSPASSYDVRVTVTDPDGGSSTQTLSATTRAAPLSNPTHVNIVAVASNAELSTAIGNARPGDVIQLAPGTYSGPISISASGTQDDPIILRGASASQVMVSAPGASYGLTVGGSHVYVEKITIAGSDWGASLAGTDDIVVRYARFTNVNKGVDVRYGTHRGFYICDNILEGRFSWPNVSSATWDQEGIVVTGEGHTVCFNRISGFGDALGLNQNTAISNRAIDFYGNDVLWSGDDGVEADYGHRNIRVFENRLTNTGMGVSVQPSWGGPIYIVRNVLVNQAAAPYKFNNFPTGILVFNNTSIRTNGDGDYAGWAWPQLGYDLNGQWAYVANFQFMNNLLVGTTGPARFTSAIRLGTIDHDGWSPDGTFTFYDTYTNLADVKARSPYEQHGVILTGPPFANAVVLGADYTTRVDSPDVTLRSASNAVDAGVNLPGVTDGFAGTAPDLGALELGRPNTHYGPRDAGTAPNPPTNVRVQ